MSEEVMFFKNDLLTQRQECPQACMPASPSPASPPPPPKNHRPFDGEDGYVQDPNEEHPNDAKDGDDNVAIIARALGKTKLQFERLVYDRDLAEITCGCGHGYFKPDKTWVSGSEVRGGTAPPKPQKWA